MMMWGYVVHTVDLVPAQSAGTVAVFGTSGAHVYVAGLDSTSGKVKWRFRYDVVSDPHAPLFNEPGESKPELDSPEMAKGIDLYAANRFHEDLGRVALEMNGGLAARYLGHLARRTDHTGAATESFALWELFERGEDPEPTSFVCTFCLSPVKRPGSVARYQVDTAVLYVEVVEIAGKRSLDDPLKALGGASLRTLFRKLVSRRDVP
jgi:hypothetical protein